MASISTRASSVEIDGYNEILMLKIMSEPVKLSIQANGIVKLLRDKTERKTSSFKTPQASLRWINQETEVCFQQNNFVTQNDTVLCSCRNSQDPESFSRTISREDLNALPWDRISYVEGLISDDMNQNQSDIGMRRLYLVDSRTFQIRKKRCKNRENE